MARLRDAADVDAVRRLRARGAARRRGRDHARPVPIAVVTVYHAPGCHLCERALAVVEEARADVGFQLRTVDIAGDAALEERYREWLPVVEIDGEREFVYFVDPAALRRKLAHKLTEP
jgi:glutaredoxin